MYDVDINKILVSNTFSLGKQGFKYFISFKDQTIMHNISKNECP